MKTGLRKSGRGLAALGPMLKDLRGSKVVTGVLGTTASRGDGGVTNVELAVIHEFGFGVPERSFLRRTFDRKKNEWEKLAQKLLRLVASGKLEIHAALSLLGERMKSDTKRTITTGSGVPPPNAPSTVARKGSSRPLVDSGRLVGSIDSEVRLKR